MVKIIRRYGLVRVEEYKEGKYPEYHVKHENGTMFYWTLDKIEAIKHAQFLAGRY